MLSLILECGSSTPGSNARFAFRMRASISEIGSVIFQRFKVIVESPTGLGHSGNQAIQRGFPEGQTGTAELAQITMAASAHRTAIHDAHRAGVLGQLGEAGVITLGFQFSP